MNTNEVKKTLTTCFEFTFQEWKVLKFATELMSNKEIADKLSISEETVKTHRKNIMKKVGIHGKREMTKFLLSLHISSIT